jgi:methionyl-tRNA formyltransferase
MRIACVGYRDWALAIYDDIARLAEHEVLIIRSRQDYSEQAIIDFKPDLVLFYGWSWHVGPAITDTLTAMMLHPSPLPRYRGGSPIQNQIIRGEIESAVTIFIMNDEMDGGDIVAQAPLSLLGHLDEIFSRISETGLALTLDFIKNGWTAVPQDSSRATIFSRRQQEDSEITLKEIEGESAQYLYDKIRMLEDPYPNAFIKCSDGRKLFLKYAELEPENSSE